MQKLKTHLKKRLKGARRIAIIAIGSDMRGDDAAGLIAAEYLTANLPSRKKGKMAADTKVLFGGTAPENITGEVIKYRPTHIIMIDTIEIQETPGTIVVLAPEEIGSGVSFSTHKLPIRIMVDYLAKRLHVKTVIIGIQPKSIGIGTKPSKVVASAAKSVARSITEAV